MGLTLISATPSPYARKNRISLIEKGIPFTLVNEVPWNTDTQTPQYNPLEKLPILLLDDGVSPPVYESFLIQEYIEEKLTPAGAPSLMPENVDDRMKAKQIEALADGCCDAVRESIFETQRQEKRSEEWLDRQRRKLKAGIKAMDAYVKDANCARDGFLVGGKLTIADVGAVSFLGLLGLVHERGLLEDVPKVEEYSTLEKYWERIEERDSFKQTQPIMFEFRDKVV